MTDTACQRRHRCSCGWCSKGEVCHLDRLGTPADARDALGFPDIAAVFEAAARGQLTMRRAEDSGTWQVFDA